MTNVIRNSAGSLVLCVDGPWGVGKSHFLRIWQEMLDHDGIPVIYLDAFKRDYQKDAFFVIASEILSAFERFDLDNTSQRKEYVQKAVKLGMALGRIALRVGVKAITAGVVNTEGTGLILDASVDEAGSALEAELTKLLEFGATQDKSIDEFKKILSSLPQLFQKSKSETAAPKLIFIVDELDRCRPDFALEVIEVLKHFFEVPGIAFVLGANIDSLASGVRNIYGTDVNGRAYLSRFIDHIVRLEVGSQITDQRNLIAFLKTEWKNAGIPAQHDDILHRTAECIAGLAVVKQIALRDLKKVVATIALSLKILPNGHWRNSQLLSGLAVMKVLSPNFFALAKSSKLSHEEFIEWLGRWDTGNEDLESVEAIKMAFNACLLPTDHLSDDERRIRADMTVFNRRGNILGVFANQIVDHAWQV